VSCFARPVADGPHVAQTQKAEGAVKQLPDARLVERMELAVERDAMDLLDGWCTSNPKKITADREGVKIVLAEELVLARAGLVDLEVSGEAVSLLDRHAVAQREALGREQFLVT